MHRYLLSIYNTNITLNLTINYVHLYFLYITGTGNHNLRHIVSFMNIVIEQVDFNLRLFFFSYDDTSRNVEHYAIVSIA